MDINSKPLLTQEHGMEKISIDNNKIGEQFKYSSSLGRAVEKTADTLFSKLNKKRQNKNDKTFSKQHSYSNSSLNLFEVISPQDTKWQIVQEALTNALLGKDITNLSEVLVSVRQLNEQFVTNVIVTFYETQILKNTLQKLQRKILMLKDLENSWIEFFRKSLPNVILILSSVKTQQEYVERISLYEFKRRLTKVEDLKEKLMKRLQDNNTDLSVLKHMFLVLQTTRLDINEVTEIDVQFEEVVSLLISPLIGYSGIFIDGELTHSCSSLLISKKITGSESNRSAKIIRAPLSGMFGQSKSLWDISGKF